MEREGNARDENTPQTADQAVLMERSFQKSTALIQIPSHESNDTPFNSNLNLSAPQNEGECDDNTFVEPKENESQIVGITAISIGLVTFT